MLHIILYMSYSLYFVLILRSVTISSQWTHSGGGWKILSDGDEHHPFLPFWRRLQISSLSTYSFLHPKVASNCIKFYHNRAR